MILKENDYKCKLDAFVEAYLFQKSMLESDIKDDCELTKAVLQYMQASKKLSDFMMEVYGEENPELPRMDVFYHNREYHDFAYQVYLAAKDAGQIHEKDMWRSFTMIHIGEKLRKTIGGKT